jgi:hypothetical protein
VTRVAPSTNPLTTVLRQLSAATEPACLLDANGIFLFVNEAWERHALAHGAPGCLASALVGTRWLDHVQGDEVRALHAALLERALRQRGPRATAVVQVSESNGPARAALLSTRLEPVLHGGEAAGVKLVHTLVRERPIEEVYDVVRAPPDGYRDAAGALTACSCCRRLRHPADAERWDFLPALLERPVAAEQALCPLCRELHYGALDAVL